MKKPLVGKRVKIVKGAYKGHEGVIEYCKKCCRAYRVEFDKIGNNTKLKDLRGKYIFTPLINK